MVVMKFASSWNYQLIHFVCFVAVCGALEPRIDAFGTLDTIQCAAHVGQYSHECDFVINKCPEHSHCVMSNGSTAECVCNYGYMGRGTICMKICPDMLKCRNRQGTMACKCITGYEWKPENEECHEYRSAVFFHKLIKATLIGDEYYPTVRPMRDSSATTNLRVSMSLKQILDINERKQYLHVNAWFTLIWIDEFVQWDPAEYGGIESIVVDPLEMWRPDIVLYDSVDETKTAFEMFTENQIQVFHSGLVKWISPTLIKTACKLNIAYYPFDIQQCGVHLGMMASNKSEVFIHNNSDCRDTGNYMPSYEWELIEIKCINNPKSNYETGSSMKFVILMQRQSMFYIFHFVFPSIVLVLLGNVVFFLPSESSERALLAMTVYLSMIVYMEVILKNRPRSSQQLSTLDTFFGSVLLLFMVLTAEAVIVLNIHVRGRQGREPPEWMQRWFLLKLSRFTEMHETAPYILGGTIVSSSNLRSQSVRASRQLNEADLKLCASNGSSVNSGRLENVIVPILLQIYRVAVEMRKWDEQEAKTGKRHLNISDTQWRMIAVIVDRICFFIFIILTIVMMVTLFMYQIPGLTPRAQLNLDDF